MLTTIYNILMHICATAVITVPAYNMMPYKIGWPRTAILSLLLFILDYFLFPVVGSAVNLVAIPLVYVLMVLSSGAHKVVNFYMITMTYMLTVSLNYVIIAALRMTGIDVLTLSLSGSIAFQLAYLIFACVVTIIIGRKTLEDFEKINPKTYKKIEKPACWYIFGCFWVYEIGILVAASKGHTIDILIINALIMTSLFVGALIVPAYLIIIMKREADKKEDEIQYLLRRYVNLAINECKTIDEETFLKYMIDETENSKKINDNKRIVDLINTALEEVYNSAYQNHK